MPRKLENKPMFECSKTIIVLIVVQIIAPFLLTAQNLGIDRVEHIKKSVGKVIIENGVSGSGFFIDGEGTFVTNYHVVSSAIELDSSANTYAQRKRIIVQLNDGQSIDMIISEEILNKFIPNAKVFDFAVLVPRTTKKPKTSFLKLGSFKNVNEGDEVLTCGYPFGIEQFFIYRGLLSTKWTELNKDKSIKNCAWLDLTMNSGNSGGPILKIGNNIEEDIVVGIASFYLNPFAFEANAIYEKALENGKVLSNYEALNMRGLAAFNAMSIKNNSLGVSGCISIDHLKNYIE